MLSRINMKVQNAGQWTEVWFVFETEHASLKAMHDEAVKTGRLFGARLETRRHGPGKDRVITGEYETSILTECITSIAPLDFDLLDEDGNVVTEEDPEDEEAA